MHELGIVFSVMETIEELGRENGLEQVASVTLEVGEVAGIVEDYFQDCWRWAVRDSALLRGSELLIEHTPAVTFCESCERTYETVRYGKVCPHCGSSRTYLLTGNQMQIKEIEAR